MAYVIDASIAAAWLLPDERVALAETAVERLADETASVPDLFWHELRNILISAEHRGRIDRHYADTSMARIRRLPIHDARQAEDLHVLALARRHRLTAHDSSYLALAIREHCPLATLDRRLNDAAAAEGLPGFA